MLAVLTNTFIGHGFHPIALVSDHQCEMRVTLLSLARPRDGMLIHTHHSFSKH